MLARQTLRLVVILAGLGVGFGTAYVLTGAAWGDPGMPRCPQCGRRHQVFPVNYTPVEDQQLKATSDNRYLGMWEPTAGGPRWHCNTCWRGFGNRFEATGR